MHRKNLFRGPFRAWKPPILLESWRSNTMISTYESGGTNLLFGTTHWAEGPQKTLTKAS